MSMIVDILPETILSLTVGIRDQFSLPFNRAGRVKKNQLFTAENPRTLRREEDRKVGR
jgi:hypothetical protein